MGSSTILIVGAGASKGALLSKTPPLDTEFFEAAKKIYGGAGAPRSSIRPAKGNWDSFVKKLQKIGIQKGRLNNWRLETLASYLEARANLNFEPKQGRPHDYIDLLNLLNRVICDLLQHSGGLEVCDIHKRLIEKTTPSAIISFNYDLILDQTLQEMDKLKWSSPYYSGTKSFNGSRWYSGERRPKLKGAIPLYKLHGSMHWQRTRKKMAQIAGVRQFLPPQGGKFQYEKIPLTPFIVPPVAAKMQIGEKNLQRVWKAAFKELKNTSNWIVWGYSFPQTDTITTVMLKTCLIGQGNISKHVTVINPDFGVKTRMREVLGKIEVEQFASATDFLLKTKKFKLELR